MGRDLVRSAAQCLQAVPTSPRGTTKLEPSCLRALGFSAGERLALKLQNGHCLLRRDARGDAVFEGGNALIISLSQRVAQHVWPAGATAAALVEREGQARIAPVFVREHTPEVLGPRLIDEVAGPRIIRHAIPGPSREGWTAEAASELEEMLCAEPFGLDPMPAIADGDDWVGWMARNHILDRPAPGDERLRQGLLAEITEGQLEDGSWGTVPATAYAVLGLLALGEKPTRDSIRRAAQWLLQLPEPSPRPGMWMLNRDYLDQWLSRREPRGSHRFAACEFQWTPPDEEINFFSWDFREGEQDEFRAQARQRLIPTCARHHPPACEPRMTHVSALVAEALLRAGHCDHPRLHRYLNTVSHLGGEWGYWCGCGALGLQDWDIPVSEDPPNFDVRRETEDGRADLLPWRWALRAAECALLANRSSLPDASERGTHLEPFVWREIPGEEHCFALLGSAWQNGDCWAKTNRALSQHPAYPGSLAADLALGQTSRYQTSLGEWDQGFPAGMLAFLSLYDHPVAKMLAIKTVPWLREHQAEDGLWHHEALPRTDHGSLADPPQPRLATYHVVAALHAFGLLGRLRPD